MREMRDGKWEMGDGRWEMRGERVGRWEIGYERGKRWEVEGVGGVGGATCQGCGVKRLSGRLRSLAWESQPQGVNSSAHLYPDVTLPAS